MASEPNFHPKEHQSQSWSRSPSLHCESGRECLTEVVVASVDLGVGEFAFLVAAFARDWIEVVAVVDNIHIGESSMDEREEPYSDCFYCNEMARVAELGAQVLMEMDTVDVDSLYWNSVVGTVAQMDVDAYGMNCA